MRDFFATSAAIVAAVPSRFVTRKGGNFVEPDKEGSMGWLDRILGRGKKAAGDKMGDSSMRREGAAQEREAMAEDRAEMHEEAAMDSREEAAEQKAERESM